jgi:hypothetical protein
MSPSASSMPTGVNTTSTFGNPETGSSSTVVSNQGNTGGDPPKGGDPKSGYQPPGAVAGIAIGTAIIGAAVAGLIFLFLLKRYRKRHMQESAYVQHLPPSSYNIEGATAEKGHVNVEQKGITVVDSYLPQPAEDDAITGELSRLRDKIKNHVQSYYITSPVDANVVDLGKLQGVAAVIGVPTVKFQELLLNPHSRLLALRLFLAWIVLSNSGTDRAGTAFLPAEVASFAALLADAENGNAGM